MKKIVLALFLSLAVIGCQGVGGERTPVTYNQVIYSGYETLIAAHKLLQNLIIRKRIKIPEAKEINAKLIRYEKTLNTLSMVRDDNAIQILQQELKTLEVDLRSRTDG